MNDVDPMSQAQIQQRIRELLDLSLTNSNEHLSWCARAYEAKTEYEIASAHAYLNAKGSIPERKAKALVECEELYREHMYTEGQLKTIEHAGRNIRHALDRMGSLAADIRDAVVHATGQGG